MADVSERLEKQMEGTNLALAAVAEVLQKMDSRLSKEDAVEVERIHKEQARYEQQEVVKAVATEVFQLLKEGTKTEEKGMDVSGDSRSAKATGKSAATADDSEKGAPIGTKIEDQQKTIQAALLRLADNDWKNEKDEDDEDDVEDVDMKRYSKRQHEDDKEEEFPVEEKGEEEDKDPDDAMDEMKMQLDALKKQIAAYESNMEKAISTEAEGRLRKMGFREERGLAAPKLSTGDSLGVDGTTIIQKAQSHTDTVDQLVDLSYGELRRLQQNIEMGQTDGVPRELLG